MFGKPSLFYSYEPRFNGSEGLHEAKQREEQLRPQHDLQMGNGTVLCDNLIITILK